MNEPQLARFQRVDPSNPRTVLGEPVTVSFNPSEYTLNKGVQIAEIAVPGLDAPLLQYVRGQTETLTLDLFFDSTDGGPGNQTVSVLAKTDKFYQLIKIDPEKHAPPVVRFTWGADFPGAHFDGTWYSQRRENGFVCLVESVRQRFTLFSPAGLPLRATLTVSLREYKSLQEQVRQIPLQSPDRTRAHVVQQGETLAAIANSAYGSPVHWRAIADHNAIDNPSDLPAGMMLEIPPLT